MPNKPRSIADFVRLYKDGADPRTVIAEVVSDIKAHNKEVNAYIDIFDDIEEQIVALEARGDKDSLPLYGVPIAMKSNILIKGKRATASSKMLEILKRQKINDRIPKYLPESTVIAHKTGELFGVKHDAGIVFSEKGDYIIVLMSDTASEAHAAEVEAKISKVVWEHFEK